MSTTQTAQAAALAQILGEEQVGVISPRWMQLMKDGVIVQLHIRRWRAKAKLTFADLGLPVKDADERAAFDELLDLGEKRLLPSKYIQALNSTDSAARKCLERCSYQTYWGAFVPCTAYEDWKEQNEAYQRRYFAILDEIIERYDAIVVSLVDNYAVAARAAYRRLHVLDPDRMTNGEYQVEDEFVDTFVGRVVNLIPTREAIRASFGFDVTLSYVPLPSILAEDLAEKERVEAEREKERLEEEMQRDALWRTVNLEREADRERQRALAAMNRDIVEKARQEKEALVDGFLGDLVVQLRTLVYDVTTNVLASMEANQGKLVGKASVQLSNLIEQVGRLNFFRDGEINQMIAGVQAALGKPASDGRDVSEIREQLQSVATITRATLLQLGERPRSARSLGVADVPSSDVVRASRQRIGLNGAEDPTILPELGDRRGRGEL